MEPQQESELASALLQWVTSFDAAAKVQSWESLEDGSVLWGILQEIDADYFHGDLPETDRKEKGSTDNWIPRWQNLKHIDRVVATYIRDECEMLPYLSKSLNPDLKAVATDGSPENIIKLVKAVLLVAMYSEKSDQRSLIVEKVGLKGASAIADAIQEMEELDQKLGDMGAETEPGSEIDQSTDSDVPTRGTSYERDPELEREEKLISALQEKRKLEEKLAYLEDDLKEAEDRRRVLEVELQESKFGLDRRRRDADEEEDFRQLSLQADRDRDFIAKLETDLAEAHQSLENKDRQLEKLRSDAESKQELRDELQLVRSERDELRQRSKANENLKKKIQALQEQEKASGALRKELQDAQDALAEINHLKDRCTALEKANEENAKTIANGEQEIFDQKTAKEQLKYELKVLSQRYEQTREMLTSAQEQIRDMEDRNQPDANADLDLEMELNADPKAIEEAKARSAAAAEKRRSMPPVESADQIVLQQKLTIAETAIARLEQRHLDLLQENLGLKAVLEDKDAKSEHPFSHQTKRLEGLEREVQEVQGKYDAAASEGADLRRLLELSESQAYGERQTSSDAAIAQNRDRQQYLEELQTQLREHRALLRHALLGNDALLKDAEDVRKANEYKIVRQQLEAVRAAAEAESDGIITSTATNITKKIESNRNAVAERDARIAALEARTTSLATDLQQARNSAPDQSQEVSKEAREDLAILQRENRLMASAWYDLSLRMQSNTVMLARRKEEPKSWLGKQRAAVGRR